MSNPKAGDVWRYPYLWRWQAERGETEGRKPRPVSIAAVLPVTGTETRLYLLAITGTPPSKDRDALEIPVTEIRRAGLTEAKPLWIIFDEHNRDTLETTYYLEPDAKVGAFSKAFLKQIAGRFRAAILRKGTSRGINRAD